MRETPQREIMVPADMRSPRPRKEAPRLSPRPAKTGSRGSDALAMIGDVSGRIAGFCIDEPGKTVGAAMALGAAIYVSVNALGMQDGRHPAPILPSAKPVAAAVAPSGKSVAPKVSTPVAASDMARDASKDAAREAAPRDPIGEAVGKAEETTASVSPKGNRDVIQAQRALSKLGYGPIKDDGIMGPGTKAAIERFERDRKLPVKGQATGKTLKELTARANQAG